jgi:hypothetical protein
MDNYRGKTISEAELSRNYMNCVFIFLMQISLSSIIYIFSSKGSNKGENDTQEDDPAL